jgi:hypothetical protein
MRLVPPHRRFVFMNKRVFIVWKIRVSEKSIMRQGKWKLPFISQDVLSTHR